MPPTLKIAPSAPAWEFAVQAVTTSTGTRAVAIRVAPGLPLAVLDAKTARKIAKALTKAADASAGGSSLPALPSLSGVGL